MGVSLALQGRSFLFSLLLGVTLGVVYDLIGAVRARQRRRGVTAAFDALYVFFCVGLTAAFSLRFGEVRLYMLLAALGGAVGYFALAARLLRPLWGFWAEVLAALAGVLMLPLRAAKKVYGKLAKLCKRYFLFSRWRFIIELYERPARRGGRKTRKRGETRHGRARAGGAAGEAARKPADDPDRGGAGGAGGP